MPRSLRAGRRNWLWIAPCLAIAALIAAPRAGRSTAVAIHPTQPNTIFVATSGGGLWSARDFNGNYPTWTPLTETLGSLAVGAFAIDPNAAADGTVTIWLGLGDAFDQQSGVL